MIDSRLPRQFMVALRLSVWISATLGVSLLLLDWLRLNHADFHPHVESERWFGFYVGLSTISCLAMAALAGIVRAVVADSEDELR